MSAVDRASVPSHTIQNAILKSNHKQILAFQVATVACLALSLIAIGCCKKSTFAASMCISSAVACESIFLVLHYKREDYKKMWGIEIESPEMKCAFRT